MKYTILRTKEFRKNVKLMLKRGKDIDDLLTIVELLAEGIPLAEKYRDHELVGNFRGYRECHIEPNWLLRAYQLISKNALKLYKQLFICRKNSRYLQYPLFFSTA